LRRLVLELTFEGFARLAARRRQASRRGRQRSVQSAIYSCFR
jgi:hypothetical protein